MKLALLVLASSGKGCSHFSCEDCGVMIADTGSSFVLLAIAVGAMVWVKRRLKI